MYHVDFVILDKHSRKERSELWSGKPRYPWFCENSPCEPLDCMMGSVTLYRNWGHNFTPFFLHIFVKFMEKGSSKSSGILIIFYEVMKLQSFECEVSASSSRLYITFHPWWFGPTKWRSYEIASVRLSVFLWNRS